MLNVGFAIKDITPEPGLTLSGFAARCNQPSEGVDDPLSVFALAIDDGTISGLLLVFDLLGLGPELLEEIQTELDCALPELPRESRVLCCTHTHSAPATITLLGCGIPERAYWDRVIAAARDAALDACSSRRPAVMRVTSAELTGLNYNRRRIMRDGTVVMSQYPNRPVKKVGPLLTRMQLIRFDDEEGHGIAGIASWPTHPCTVCSQQITADYPGELRRRLAAKYGLPFLFLTGACGNINPPWQEMTRETMLRNVEAMMELADDVAWPPVVVTEALVINKRTLSLKYSPLPPRDELQAMYDGMVMLAETGSAPAETLASMANILNVAPGEEAGPMTRYMAATLAQWCKNVLDRVDQPETCDVALTVWKLGPLVLCFVSAEVFVEYALQLQSHFPDLDITVVSYASPNVGYLPTDEALGEGGYEVDSAYRFYNHPAPFAVGAEGQVVGALEELIDTAFSSSHAVLPHQDSG